MVGVQHIGLDEEVSSVGAGALGGARPVHALRDVVGVLPRGTVCADAGGPVSRGPAVLVEQARHEAGLPLVLGVKLGLLNIEMLTLFAGTIYTPPPPHNEKTKLNSKIWVITVNKIKLKNKFFMI